MLFQKERFPSRNPVLFYLDSSRSIASMRAASGGWLYSSATSTGNKISYVGVDCPTDDFERIIDAKGMVAMPGLVNAHTHTAMTILRSYADD
ncbi:MAG: hypothetical protein II369_03295, partial [Clostridia bacterium]|nr:hypothetical protein [Clostridia bacterium]